MKNGIYKLESAVMRLLLDGDDPTLRVLSEQFRNAKVTNRILSGVGFVTKYDIPANAPRLSGGRRTFSFGDVVGDLDGLQHGVGFVLHVREGVIDCIEGFSYDEPWPATLGDFQLRYAGKDGRDLAELHKSRRV